jgi:hypothetical protein
MAGDGVTVGHGKFFDGLNSGIKQGGIVAVNGTDIAGAKNGDEELEFTINGSSDSDRTDNIRAKGSGGDK